ncbi:MAG: hypothetical protein PUA56_06515 [Bacillales bacterium]|nr:hypothetical protein [Bacillales bacterium]
MKKEFGIIITCLFALGVFVGCNHSGVSSDTNNGNDVTSSIVNKEWHNDKANHWHLNGSEKVDFGAHKFVKDVAKSKDATCVEKGLLVETCSDCGFKREVVLAMTDHTYVENKTKSVAATCDTAGKIVDECSHCHLEKVTDIAALGHNWVADPTDPANHASTHTTNGISVDKCSTCGEKRENKLDMVPHTWVEVEGDTLTTASGKTVKKWRCECGTYSYTMNVYDFDFLSPGSNAVGIDGYTPGGDVGNAGGIRIAGNGSVYWNFPIVAEGLVQVSIGTNPAPTSIGGTKIESKNTIKVNDAVQTLIPQGAYNTLPITVGQFDELLFTEFTANAEMVGKEAKIEITQKASSRLYFGGVIRVTIIAAK